MNCSQYRELLPDLLCSTASEEHAGLKQHLVDCDECRRELGRLAETLALLPVGLQPVPSPNQFTDGVVERIRTQAPSNSDQLSVAERNAGGRKGIKTAGLSPQYRFLAYALAASLLLAFLGAQSWYLNRIRELAMATRDPSNEERERQLDESVAQLRALEKKSRDTRVRFVSFLARSDRTDSLVEPSDPIRARGIWDAGAGELHFLGFGMEQLPTDQTYALWYSDTSGPPRLAYEFNADKDRNVSIVVPIPQSDAKRLEAQIIITVESKPVGRLPSSNVWLRSDER